MLKDKYKNGETFLRWFTDMDAAMDWLKSK